MALSGISDRVSIAGTSIEYGLVPWDSEIFGFPVAEIRNIEIAAQAEPSTAFETFRTWCDDHRVRFVTCRLDHRNLRESMFLEQMGFCFIEMVFSPRLVNLHEVAFPPSGVSWVAAGIADLPEIEGIAGTAFGTGRYLLDWRLEPELSHRRYQTWVRNSFSDSRHSVLKGCVNGEIAGFFIVERKADDRFYWHLTAVAPAWQGKGVGKRLWQAMIMEHKHAGGRQIETTVSAHNPPVLNLYARLGFELRLPKTTFHWIRR